MKFTLLNITDEEITFNIENAVTMTATYKLDFSHSEGKWNIDPQRDSYIEYFELELNDEVLVDLGETEEYRSWSFTKEVYQFIRRKIQDYNFHIQLI